METIEKYQTKMESKIIKFELTPEQITEKQESLVEKVVTRGRLKSDLKRIATDLRKQIKDLDEEVGELADVLRDGHEERLVQCRLVPDHQSGVMFYYDEYDAIVFERELKQSERQLTLIAEE